MTALVNFMSLACRVFNGFYVLIKISCGRLSNCTYSHRDVCILENM